LTKKASRPDYPKHELFGALIFKNPALNNYYRTIEAMITQDRESASIVGLNDKNTPNDSTLRRYFADLTLEKIELVQECLLNALQSLDHAKGCIIALDSPPIEAHCKVSIKRRKNYKNP